MQTPRIFALLVACTTIGACDGGQDRAADGSLDRSTDGATDALPEAAPDAPTEGGSKGGGADAAAGASPDAAPDAPDAAPCGWTAYNDGLSGGTVKDVLFDPRALPSPAPEGGGDAVVLYATAGNTLFRSPDNGATWATQGTFAGGSIDFLATPGTDPSVLFASSSAGVIESTDTGRTWSPVSFQNVGVTYITAAPSQPLRLYAAVVGDGIYRSDDQGSTWAAEGQGYPSLETLVIDVAPDNPDEAVAGGLVPGTSQGAIVRTTDGGDSWQTVVQDEGVVSNIRRCDTDASVLYGATVGGVAKSTDRGATWTVTPQSNRVEDVAITPGACNDIYAMVYSVGPLHSTDGGASFGPALTQGLNLVTPGDWPGRMAIAPQLETGFVLDVDGGVPWDNDVVVGSHGGIRYSYDAGAQWSTGEGILGMSLRSLMTSPLDPGHLWLASWGSGVWHRPSTSASWERVPASALPVDLAYVAAPDPYTANRVFAAGSTLYQSTDDGVTFGATSVQGNVFAVGFDPSDANTLYAVTQMSGVFKSTNGGTSWSTSNGNLTAWTTIAGTFIDVRSIVVDPSAHQTLYIGTNGGGVQKSTDAGGSWSNVLSPTGTIDCLTMASGTLYACVSGGGVQASTDGGATWTDASQGLPTLDVNGLAYDPTGASLYATTGTGVFVRTSGQAWASVDPACAPAGGMITTPAIVVEGGARTLVVGAAGGVAAHSI